MFPWNIAKSAEAMFSRWAVKRVCKFLLKKKLGQFILGDIDLDQLDVQLSQGTIQLNDLALNVDYVNKKLGEAVSLMVKEGSIGSLSVKMPWRGKGCQVEVNDLELVISPIAEKNSTSGDETRRFGEDSHRNLHFSSTGPEHEMEDNAAKSTFMDVHEGVKTIAKMVKWFLTSFHVKISNLIVAFDPNSGKEDKKTECPTSLVLRISEIECGTCISEDAESSANILGISQLTNFVKFQGGIIELLHMDDAARQACCSHALGASFGEPVSRCCLKRATSPIMTGKKGGFCGNVKLSIPWKNGSLDARKLDADVSIDPLVLRFQPSTIKWLSRFWETYTSFEKESRECTHYNSTDSVHLKSISLCHSPSPVSGANAADVVIPVSGSSPADISSFTLPGLVTEALLPGAHLISDWVPFSINKNKKDVLLEEIDFGASVDQFFECIDGVRSFQSALGSSGVWNWTCSVFSAITAASSLASGSLHIPSEQKHVETNLRVTLLGISIVFSLHGEEQNHFCAAKSVGDSDIIVLGAELREIRLVCQVCPRATVVEGTVKYMEVAHFLSNEADAIGRGLQEYDDNNINNNTVWIQHLQHEVHGALPQSASYTVDPDSDESTGLGADLLFGDKIDLVKVVLFKTSGVTHAKIVVESSSSHGSVTGPTSFSLTISPFTLWLQFPVINMIMDLLKDVEKMVEVKNKRNEISLKASGKNYGSSLVDVTRGSSTCVKTLPSTETLHGDILIPNARVFLCFPLGSGGDHIRLYSWEQFIVLDFTSPSSLNKGGATGTSSISDASSKKRYPSTATRSLQLNLSDLNIYLVSSDDSGKLNSCNSKSDRFSAEHFLSVTNKTGFYSIISMVWQDGQVTGPWIAKKAKLLATSEVSRGRDDFAGRGYEFASVSTVKDLEDLKSQTRQEMILSSTFFMHVNVSEVTVNLSSSQYRGLNFLLGQMLNRLSCMTSDAATSSGDAFVLQTSIFVESETLKVVISLDTGENTRGSMQSELPGLWCQLKLDIQKFELLSVKNTGGIEGANFLRLAHGEGKLWGSVDEVPSQEFLLISCSNSSMKRGDGGGSNALLSRLAGSDIVNFWDPESLHNVTSITISCGTVVAVGGRLDWFNGIFSFFSSPSTDIKEASDDSVSKRGINATSTATFVLNLVDVGLSYEPYMRNPSLESGSGFSYITEEMGEQCVTCLLAASSLTLSNSTVEDLIANDYKIRLQDLGLLLHVISGPEIHSGTYSVEHLQKTGYVKVAEEALVEAILKTNCRNGLIWELELSKSHIYVKTCHDTTTSLVRLASQLQQLFAPDVEESIVHLQSRWDSVKQAQQRDDFNGESSSFCSDRVAATAQACTSKVNTEDDSRLVGLMDEICENAFHVNNNSAYQADCAGSGSFVPLVGSFDREVFNKRIDEPEIFSHEFPFSESPLIGLESSQTSFLQKGNFPEIIEGYCLSELRPLSELSVGLDSPELLRYQYSNMGNQGTGRGSGQWYGDTSLKILENHISEASKQTASKNLPDCVLPSDPSTHNGIERACGRLLLKNINIRWRIYSGSDWHDSTENGENSANICGRDTTVCLELALSGMRFQYDIFPVGGVYVSKMFLSVQDFHLYDRSKDAPWKLILGYYNSKDHPRESSSKSFKLELEAVRPDPLTPLEEYRLRIAVLPILLHLHQCQLDFLISFFGGRTSTNDLSSNCCQNSEGSKLLPEKSKNLTSHTIELEALLPYFQKFNIRPLLVRVDYSPHHVDLAALRRGKYVELVNLVPWKGVELCLKNVESAGIYGWGSVCETILGEWLEDISQNQIHKILRGVPTVRSLIAVGAGAAKLVSSPVENYKKEHRVLKGMQRGTFAFLRSISLEAVGLGVHLAAGAHDILLQAEYILTSIPASVTFPVQDKSMIDARCNQPKDAQQGIKQAYERLSDGLGKSASVLVQSPLKKYQRGSGAGPALATAVRAVPAAAIAPASACASAVHCALLGFRNSLDPERKKESIEKYCPTQPWEERGSRDD
ncbi:Autophagy-related protein 2 [Quillaja saponaria]|uniref:Autophagy-related protein 2 n=1 Tax=Quillaja saponaria TaxID=32244 RepID=A0AAD7M016_QUISA|nr:Autophagy-related protein 2 [Quillaja saponaria]